jgi:hypothetical protein
MPSTAVVGRGRQEGDQCPVRPSEAGSANLASKDCQFVAEDQDLGLLAMASLLATRRTPRVDGRVHTGWRAPGEQPRQPHPGGSRRWLRVFGPFRLQGRRRLGRSQRPTSLRARTAGDTPRCRGRGSCGSCCNNLAGAGGKTPGWEGCRKSHTQLAGLRPWRTCGTGPSMRTAPRPASAARHRRSHRCTTSRSRSCAWWGSRTSLLGSAGWRLTAGGASHCSGCRRRLPSPIFFALHRPTLVIQRVRPHACGATRRSSAAVVSASRSPRASARLIRSSLDHGKLHRHCRSP